MSEMIKTKYREHYYKILIILVTIETQPNFIALMFYKWLVGWFMVFNATFNNISVILCRSVLLVEETRVHGENH